MQSSERIPRTLENPGTVSGARRSGRAQYRFPGRQYTGHRPQRNGYCHSGHFGGSPHAGCAGNAVPPEHHRSRTARRKGVHLPSGGTFLSGGRCDRRLLFCRTAQAWRQTGVSGHGALFDGQDKYLQRTAAAVNSTI